MVTEQKTALRKKILTKRNSLTSKEIETMSDSICKRLIAHPRFVEAKIVAFYIPKGNEVNTKKMIEAAMRKGKNVLAPITEGHSISFQEFTSFNELVVGKFGILEPKENCSSDTKPAQYAPPAQPALIIVPGVVFGLCMHRIGYGKGYYDRYLAKSAAYRIGICYDFQVVEKLPTHEDDQRMDEIITDKRVIL